MKLPPPSERHDYRGRTVETWEHITEDVAYEFDIYEFFNVWGDHIGYHYEPRRSDSIEPEVKTIGAMGLDRAREFAKQYAGPKGATWELTTPGTLTPEILADLQAEYANASEPNANERYGIDPATLALWMRKV